MSNPTPSRQRCRQCQYVAGTSAALIMAGLIVASALVVVDAMARTNVGAVATPLMVVTQQPSGDDQSTPADIAGMLPDASVGQAQPKQSAARQTPTVHTNAYPQVHRDAPATDADASLPVASKSPSFNGRPLRVARTMTMLVTAYSPDARSCGKWADGNTASGYSVWTNGMKLVAADTRLLPFGSIISIPGYNGGKPVPVLDRGGKIKGHRLDVLYPTHEIARQWGAQRLTVTIYEYAD